MNKYFNELAKKLEWLGRTYDLSQVFNDLLTMGICSYHKTNIQTRLQEKDEANEKLYMQTIEKYKKKDLDDFAQMLGLLQLNVLDYPYSDVLGEYFTQHITRGQNGQFFTPEPICDFMALTHGDADKIVHQRVLDPACGSGRMLLRFAKHYPDNYFFAADVNNTCAKMSTLNFFLNGLRGEVAWMNSLSMEFFGAWHINTEGLGIIPIEKEQSIVWSSPPPIKETKSENQSKSSDNNLPNQLTLF